MATARGRGAEQEPDAKPAGLSAPEMRSAAQTGGRELRARIPGSARWDCGLAWATRSGASLIEQE
jgi:hypothetical protein